MDCLPHLPEAMAEAQLEPATARRLWEQVVVVAEAMCACARAFPDVAEVAEWVKS